MSEKEKLENDFQNFYQQLQTITLQKESLKLEMAETEKAIEELSSISDESVYEIVGPVMIKKSRSDTLEKLKSRKEDLEVKIKSLQTIEDKLTKKLVEIQEKLKGG